MTLGKRIQAARKKANLTQRQVGAALGITDAAVSEWERDESSPEIDRLAKLVRVLKTTAKWLVDGQGEPPDQDDPEALLERLTPTARRQAIRLLRMLAEDDSAAA
jgi:transcriptional regulator with XRE-family HTH domain